MAKGKGKGKLVSKDNPKPDTEKEANAEPGASEQVKKGEETPAAVSGAGKKIEGEKKEEPNANSNNEKSTLKKKKRLRKKKKISAGGEASVGKNANKAETSGPAGKGPKRAPGMGLIFMCNSQTKKDCYQYKVLGLPASKKDIVEKVYKGMRLFLFDFDLRLMYGVYKAAGPGGYNIEPKAFKSAFPSQVRFTVLDDCVPLPEEKFKAAIKDNYYGKNKFNCELTPEQVKNLCKLFRSQTEGGRPKQAGGGPAKRVPRGFADGERKRRRPPLDIGPPPRRGPPRAPLVYERDPYIAPLPPSYVRNRRLDLDYHRREPPRALGLRDRDEREYRDPYSYREAAPYREPLYSSAPAPTYAPLYRY